MYEYVYLRICIRRYVYMQVHWRVPTMYTRSRYMILIQVCIMQVPIHCTLYIVPTYRTYIYVRTYQTTSITLVLDEYESRSMMKRITYEYVLVHCTYYLVPSTYLVPTAALRRAAYGAIRTRMYYVHCTCTGTPATACVVRTY